MQRFLVPIFTFIWWRRLHSVRLFKERDYVAKVKNWRTAIIDKPGYGRQTVAFCFWWFK